MNDQPSCSEAVGNDILRVKRNAKGKVEYFFYKLC